MGLKDLFSKARTLFEIFSLMRSLIPLAIFALNFYVGSLVADGKIGLACQNDVLNAFVDFGGFILIGLTSVFSLFHALNHSPVENKSTEINFLTKMKAFIFKQEGGGVSNVL